MPDLWVPLAVAAVVLTAVGLALKGRAKKPRPVAFADAREERLARRVAGAVRSSPASVLAAVRHEVELAPHQPDDTLVKRAVYHYQQSAPERTCSPYRDASPG